MPTSIAASIISGLMWAPNPSQRPSTCSPRLSSSSKQGATTFLIHPAANSATKPPEGCGRNAATRGVPSACVKLDRGGSSMSAKLCPLC
eukprot:scaffold70776_cov31-Tisochrysis_lutea.AAC.1